MKMNFKNVDLKNTNKKIWAVLLFFAKHIILSCFTVVLISIGVGFLIFYSNITLVNQENLDSMDSSLDIKKASYDQIIKTWNDESQRKEEADSKSFTNIFFSSPQSTLKPSPSVKSSPKPSLTPIPILETSPVINETP